MRIDPLNSKIASEIHKVESAKKVDRDKAKAPVSRPDTSDFSSKAQRLSETRANADIVATQVSVEPEIREDKVAEVRKKIDSGFYNSSEFVDKLAEKLLTVFGITK
jgi:anti-sigma28 factor (negative regulator of flagellin synthesis)